MGFNRAHGYVNCWQCGGHRLLHVIEALTGWKRTKVVQAIAGLEYDYTVVEHSGTYKPPKHVGPLLKHHKKYLRGRGFKPKQIAKVWGVGGIGNVPPNPWRIFIPISYQGRNVSWTTRAISNDSLKYWSASKEREAIPHGELLYGEHYARDTIIICEGPLDVWAIGPGAVGTFGVGFSDSQVMRMVKYPTRVVCFDAEDKAQGRAERLCDALEVFPGDTYNVELPFGDIAERPKDARKLRERFLSGM